MAEAIGSDAGSVLVENRRIRVFISSTFRDMKEDRDALMSHTWPQLRQFCLERHVELVEVDMRWGISEEQSTRKETLKLCLDEIRSCRPYFIGLIGERYGWIPGDEVFNADLKEEQPWIVELNGKSVTELEILHGVLNNPKMAGRSFFYFRDPAYSKDRGPDFQAEDADATGKLDALKKRICEARDKGQIELHEKYPDPAALSDMVFKHLKTAIGKQFPKEDTPDPLIREADSHESFAEIRRRTYIGRDAYYKTLDQHADNDSGPLVLLGDSGSGKSALLANWIAHWKKEHTGDFIFQHYIGSTPDSADHWQLMRRLMAEIKKWTDDLAILPASYNDMIRDFPLWLSKARLKAQRDSVRCIIILDALNQLEDRDNSRHLGWLPPDTFREQLRLIVSTLPGETLDAVKKYGWESLHIEKLTDDERRKLIVNYLKRFSKRLDQNRIDRIVAVSATANPLYLKILLDELRVTGTHDKLGERLNAYLAEPDIPSLLRNVLSRYQLHYESDRKGLVKEALGLIFSSRRGLSEIELLQLLRPADLEQLPQAFWTPLKAAMEDLLIDRGGILNFAHDFLRTAVKDAFVPDPGSLHAFRVRLADYFEKQPVSTRSCDELPWLLQQIKSTDRLRTCLLEIMRFMAIFLRDKIELRGYWIGLGEQTVMGKAYLESFEQWINKKGPELDLISGVANHLAVFLENAALYKEAETLMRRGLSVTENRFGKEHPNVARELNNIASLLQDTNRQAEAEPLYRKALSVYEKNFGNDHPSVAMCLNNLAGLLRATNRPAEAEPLYRKALSINENSFGKDHPNVALNLNNLALLLRFSNRQVEAEPLFHRALSINERKLGKGHLEVATNLNGIAGLLCETNRTSEAEPLYRRALSICEKSLGKDHPTIAVGLNNLALLLQKSNRPAEAEQLYRRALNINEKSLGKDHLHVAICLSNLVHILYITNRAAEAEPLFRRILRIDENRFGKDHPEVAVVLGDLALLLLKSNRIAEAETLLCRALSINENSFGKEHPEVAKCLNHLAALLCKAKRMAEAEPLLYRALKINENSFGKEHSNVTTSLNGLAGVLFNTNRIAEAESVMRRMVIIFVNSSHTTGHEHPQLRGTVKRYVTVLQKMGFNQKQVMARLLELGIDISDGQ